jgi:hypothetical protein
MTKQEGPVLYRGSNGRIACERHTPVRGSDTWRRERWARMSDRYRAELAAALAAIDPGARVGCETCTEEGSPP